MAYLLVLITGQDPTSTAILMNVGDTPEQCELKARDEIAKRPVKVGRVSLEAGGKMEWTDEPGEKHWRFHCIPQRS